MDQTVAYFCAEYAIDPKLPIYAGGLGVLAGDYLKEADDQHLPVIAVGLYYHFQNNTRLELLTDASGNPLQVAVPIADKKILVQAFLSKVGAVPLYLLDTNLPENELSDRQITDKLYVQDKETRLKQELILGIGGQKILEVLGIRPRFYHLNEGHSAFLALELIRYEIKSRQIGFTEAIEAAKTRIVFTNHTLLAAGNHVYDSDLVALMVSGYARDVGVPVSEIVKLGLVPESSAFSMTLLSLRMAGKINAVSAIHAKKASEIWTHHPMISITNGIHIPTWDRVKDVKNHQVYKQELLNRISQVTGITWQPNHLLLGWARRFVEYKRPLSIIEDLERFLSIAQNVQHPVNLVFSGKPHSDDEKGNQLRETLNELIDTKLKGTVVYLPDYGMELAGMLTAGCDVWLNTPIVGFEACGTSGMKAALNGVLPCSTSDGWMAEAAMNNSGWILESDRIRDNILDVLEREIVPLYYDHQDEWGKWMENARSMVLNQFSATRMMNEYVEKLYS